MNQSFNGKPINGTYQYITERPYKGTGKTVGGSNSDSGGRDSVSFGGESDLQEKILKEHILNPGLNPTKIADRVGCCRTTVWRVVNRQSKEERYQKDDFSDLSENASRVVWVRAADPDKTQRAIAEQVGVSEGYVSHILSNNAELVDQAREDISPYLDQEAER